MIRNLKILLFAAMAVAAFGAFSAAGAQAAEFHCTPAAGQTGCTLTLEKDGTGKTAHHVLEFKNKGGEATALTCEGISGHSTLNRTATTVVFTGIAYHHCTFNGSVVEIKMNGCNYQFTSHGKVSIVGCEAGKEIEIITPTCTVKWGEQSNMEGVTYHNVGTPPNRTITLGMKVTFAVTSLSGANCGIKLEGPYTGHYTTGNAIIKGEEDPGINEVDTWWQ